MDHSQKVLILGEAMDFGTCKAKKKNGDSCTQLVNMVGFSLFTSLTSFHLSSCSCFDSFRLVYVPVLPVPRQGSVQEDEL